jgi:hypothetical protein
MSSSINERTYKTLVAAIIASAPDKRVGCQPYQLLEHLRQVGAGGGKQSTYCRYSNGTTRNIVELCNKKKNIWYVSIKVNSMDICCSHDMNCMCKCSKVSTLSKHSSVIIHIACSRLQIKLMKIQMVYQVVVAVDDDHRNWLLRLHHHALICPTVVITFVTHYYQHRCNIRSVLHLPIRPYSAGMSSFNCKFGAVYYYWGRTLCLSALGERRSHYLNVYVLRGDCCCDQLDISRPRKDSTGTGRPRNDSADKVTRRLMVNKSSSFLKRYII